MGRPVWLFLFTKIGYNNYSPQKNDVRRANAYICFSFILPEQSHKVSNPTLSTTHTQYKDCCRCSLVYPLLHGGHTIQLMKLKFNFRHQINHMKLGNDQPSGHRNETRIGSKAITFVHCFSNSKVATCYDLYRIVSKTNQLCTICINTDDERFHWAEETTIANIAWVFTVCFVCQMVMFTSRGNQ